MDLCARLPTSSEVDEEALTWMEDQQDGDKIHQDGTIEEQDDEAPKQHEKPINLKVGLNEEAVTWMEDPQDGDKNLQDETDHTFPLASWSNSDEVLAEDASGSSKHDTTNRIGQNETRRPEPLKPRPMVTRKPRKAYDTLEKQWQRAKAMTRNTRKNPKQVVSDSKELTVEMSNDLFNNPDSIIIGYYNSLDDVKAVSTDSNNNDDNGDDNSKIGSDNNVSDSINRIKNLEEELGISDGLGSDLIEVPADSGSCMGDNVDSGHFRSSRNIANTNNQNSHPKFPEDSYSFIALNGPEKNGSWSRERKLFFLSGFLPFVFQMVFLGLLLFSQTNALRGTIGETDNPDEEKEELGTMALLASFIPANSTPIIRWAQVTSLTAYLIFPDASLMDIMRSIRLFPRASKREIDHLSLCVVLSCLLRLVQGIAAMIVTLLLVLTSTTVVDIILNFTAVNFISDLDEYAFSLAKTGEFSPSFQDEAERIAKTELPCCMKRGKGSKWKCNRIVGGLVSVFFLFMLVFIFYSQDSHAFWVTGILRVQFQDSELNQYSGCFKINSESSSVHFSRRTYHSFEDGPTNSSIGYCRKERQWIVFKGNSSNPCDVSNRSDVALALSSKTDSFDIATIYDESWVSPSNTPLDLYFFEGKNEAKIREQCDQSLGDGKCDTVFNEVSYGYDDGDCCASTCTELTCGSGGLTSVFGDPVSGDGFENCVDPAMFPITIQLNHVKSNRDPKYRKFRNFNDTFDDAGKFLNFEKFFNNAGALKEWENARPVSPYFALDCDGKNVMTAYIQKSMAGRSHTVMVQDGATCKLVIRNSTTSIDIITDDPILLIDYTIYHDTIYHVNEKEDAKVEILKASTAKEDTMPFKRIPECYFRKLEKHIDFESIYTVPAKSYSYEAINWLLNDNSRCEDLDFIERYALVAMNFDLMNTTNTTSDGKTFNGGGNACTWPSIICDAGILSEIKLRDAGLKGSIPSELGLLSTLGTLQIFCDQMESLNDIKIPESLRTLDFTSMKTDPCVKFPTEIFNEDKIQELDFSNNDLTNNFPTAIEQLTSLPSLVLRDSGLTGFPPSIGHLEGLQRLDMAYNRLTDLPFYVGYWNLTSLQTLDLTENNLSGNLSASIVQLTSLQTLNLGYNSLTRLPFSIGELTSLQTLDMVYNQLTELTPTIGQLVSLQTLVLADNELTNLPDSIGRLTSLQTLALQRNSITELPSSIGGLTSLQALEIPSSLEGLTRLQTLDLIYNELTNLPDSIGRLTSLQTLALKRNSITELPSSIGELVSLQTLDLTYNGLSELPSSIEGLTNLQTLELGFNKLTKLSSSIGQLTSLQKLDLDYNLLTELPSSIGKLVRLQTLDLTADQLTELPSSIGRLASLQDLRLAQNELTFLPDSIGQLANLETLDLRYNKLTCLPSSIWDLPNLQTLYLDENPFDDTTCDFDFYLLSIAKFRVEGLDR